MEAMTSTEAFDQDPGRSFRRVARGRGGFDATTPLPGFAWAVGTDLTLLWVAGAPERLRRTCEDAVGRPLLDVLSMGGAAGIAETAHRRALDGHPSNFEFGVGGRTYEARVEPLQEDGDRIVGAVAMAIDVTDRHREAGDRLASDAGFRGLVEAVPAITYTAEFGAIGQWRYVSPQIESILGFTAGEWMSEADLFFSRVHPEDQERYLQAEEEARRTGHLSVEYRLLARDGRIARMRDDGVAVPESASTPALLQGVMFDVTERARAEEALRESEDRYRSLVDLSPDAILVHSDGVFVFANEAAARLLRAEEPAVLVGRPILEVVHPDHHEVVRGRVRGEERGQRQPPLEQRFIRRDGTEVDVEVAGIPLTYRGRPAGQIVVRDITGRKAVERRLRDAESRYRTLVETIPMVTYILERGELGRVLYVSPQVERVFEYTPEECLSDRELWRRMLHAGDRARVLAQAMLHEHTEEPFSAEYRVVAGDGRTVWIRNDAVLLRDEAGRGRFWQGVMIDITERMRSEHDLQRALEVERKAGDRLRALDEMKNTFLHAVSHELRTPLAAVLGFALTLARADLDLSVDESRDIAVRIAVNARKLDRLLTDLLDLDRLDRGILEPARHPTDLGALVRRVVRESDLAAQRTVEIRGEPLELSIDPAKVERIVENLVANAVRHTPGGTRVWVLVEPASGGGLLTVEDDGPGVPEELRDEVFEPFRRGPAAPSHSPGVGVGLSLVARFAQLHGGRAWVEERDGGGASFRVFLPG